MLFGYKIVKIEVFGENGALLASVDKGFVFPRNLDSDEESILIIKGRDLPELERGVRVTVIAYSKAGDRIKYLGEISMAHSRQMNVSLQKYRNTQLLEERRRYFKIKVDLKGRVLFLVRGDDTIRFEEPVNIGIQDINVGGIFMSSSYEFMQDDCVCVDIVLNDGYRLNTMARVLRVQTGQDNEVLGYGCAFESLTAAQEDAIGKYINHQQLLLRAKQNGEE